MSDQLAIPLPPELVDQVAERVAAILADRVPAVDHGYLGVAAAAAFLDCPTSRLYALVSANRIPHHKDGSRLLFDRAELRAYVDRGGATRP